MTDKLKLVSAITTIGACMLWERVSNMRPTSVPAIPPNFDAITPEWLTSALCRSSPDAAVTSFRLAGRSEGTTSRALIEIDYNEAGKREGLPDRVFAKAVPHLTARLMVGLSESTHKEVRFFNTLRQELDIEAPIAYFGGYEVPSQRSMLLLKVLDDHVFTDPTMYINRQEAEDMMAVLAALHAKYWNSPRLQTELRWVHKSYDYMVLLNKLGFAERAQIGIDRSAHVIPPELLKRRKSLYPAVMRSLQLNNGGAQTLLHHDVHIGNWYKTPAGRMGLGDWQVLVQGGFACDVAYAISAALTIEDRRAWEKDLLRLYLEKLRAAGVADAPLFDDAWLRYRQQFFHGFVFWIYTIGAGTLQPNMQPDNFSLINIERFTNAMVDHESLESLD